MRKGRILYFPYLYARQSELLALRSLRVNYPVRDVLIPILEPVNRAAAPLVRVLNEFGEGGDNLVVVTNPHQHDFHAGNFDGWIGPVEEAINTHGALIPGLLCTHTTTIPEIRDFLARYRGRDVALLYLNSRLTEANAQRLARGRMSAST